MDGTSISVAWRLFANYIGKHDKGFQEHIDYFGLERASTNIGTTAVTDISAELVWTSYSAFLYDLQTIEGQEEFNRISQRDDYTELCRSPIGLLAKIPLNK